MSEIAGEVFDDGGPSAPLIIAMRFISKALGEDEEVDTPLEDLVTQESMDAWNLDEVKDMIESESYGLGSRTRYLSPNWAKVILVQTPPEGRVYRGPRLAFGYGVFVRYDDELRECRRTLTSTPSSAP